MEIIWREEEIKKFHTNGMRFEARDNHGNICYEWIVYSVGGGTIAEEGDRENRSENIYPLSTMDEIIKWYNICSSRLLWI